MWIIFIVVCLLVALAYFLLPFALRWLGELQLQRRCRRGKAIALTYDDGPGLQLTPKLLDLMQHHDVRASFFVLGRSVSAHPDQVRRVEAAGHTLGSHSFSHLNAWTAPPLRVWKDVAEGFDALQRSGVETRYFRPPYGKMNLLGLLQAWREGLRLGWWTIDSRDLSGQRSVEDVVAEISRRQGGVVLMHDLDRQPGAEDEDRHVAHVLALTRAIIGFARSEGYSMKTLPELVEESQEDRGNRSGTRG